MYQWLIAWQGCITALRDRERSESNPVIAVGVEADGAGNLDDVVLYRAAAPHSYAQVKYAVDATSPVNEKYLLARSESGGPSILAKISKAWRTLAADGEVELALVTSRAIDPSDALLSCCDSRTLFLLPKAGQKTARSALGKARARWAAAAELSEEELLELLGVLKFDTGVTPPRLREAVAAQMSALGLPDDNLALEAGGNWVARQVRDGRKRLELAVIDQGVSELWPHEFPVRARGARMRAGTAQPGMDNNDEALQGRLRQLPPACEAQIMAAWQSQPDSTWQLVTDLTAVQARPADVVAGWARHLPPWLDSAAWQIQLAAGELAGAYGAPRLAADLFVRAAEHGAFRRDFCLARAAFIYHELDDTAAACQVLEKLGPPPSPDPYARAAVALLAGDVQAAAEELDRWVPEPADQMVHALARVSVALLLSGQSFTRECLNEMLQIATDVLAAQQSSTFSILRARFLIIRARRGESPNWDNDLREALNLLLKARDDRRVFRGDSTEAVIHACHAAQLMADPHMVITLGTVSDNGATALEASSPIVHEYVAIAALEIGDLSRAREHLATITSESARARLAPLLAEAEHRDPEPLWRRAIEMAEDDEQLARALFGLARCGVLDLPRLEELTVRYPNEVVELRAVAELASGNTGWAIAQLRSRRRSSITAAMNLAQGYGALGRMDDQVQTLTDAADHFGDASLRFSAATVLTRAGRNAEAERVLDRLLSDTPPEWSGRAEALRLAAHVAYDDHRLDRVCDLLGMVLRLEPDDTRTRWTLIRILINRGDLTAAWRHLSKAPHPLDPTSVADARAWIQLHVRRASAKETVTGCVRLLRRFIDDEEFSLFIITNLLALSSRDDPLSEVLNAEVQDATERFFERWPAQRAQRLHSFDPHRIIDDISDLIRPDPQDQLTRKRLVRGLLTGQLPLSLLAASAHRTYAEVLIDRDDIVIAARHPGPVDLMACAETVRRHADKDAVQDTAAALVLQTLPPQLREDVLGVFARVMTTDAVMLDALGASDKLALRKVGTAVWDDRHDRVQVIAVSPAEISRQVSQASALLSAIESLTRIPQPATEAFDRLDAPAIRAWASVADLAQQRQVALWSDDSVLRAHARQVGIATTSTTAILDYLLGAGRITAEAHEQAIRALIKAHIGDMPLNEPRLLELAEDEGWRPTHVALALSRPAAWADALRAVNLFGRLTIQIRSHCPETLPRWLYYAVRGAAISANTPEAATDITALLLTVAIQVGRTPAHAALPLMTAARDGLAYGADPDSPASPDPLPRCACLLRDDFAQELSIAEATRLALSLFAGLADPDRYAVLEALFS
ncbi:hypothetical protein ACFFOP_01475 [Sinosporangium siamense]